MLAEALSPISYARIDQSDIMLLSCISLNLSGYDVLSCRWNYVQTLIIQRPVISAIRRRRRVVISARVVVSRDGRWHHRFSANDAIIIGS